MTRTVTERDFRNPEFADAKVEDYEFRGDGKLVRKDRWEMGICKIVSILGMNRNDFEIPDVVKAVAALERAVNPRYECKNPECGHEGRLSECERRESGPICSACFGSVELVPTGDQA